MARAYVYDMVDTWNAGATTFTAIKMNVTDTASAAGSLLMDLTVGTTFLTLRKNGLLTLKGNESEISIGYPAETNLLLQQGGLINNSFGYVAWSSSATAVSGANRDLFLARDAANTLSQRNGTNAQTFRLYNTYTDASNYERAVAGWSGNIFYFGTQAAGTGTGSREIFFFTNGTNRWSIGGSSGNLLAAADNTYDIGANGANRPKDIWAAGSLYAGANIYNASGGSYAWGSTRSLMKSPADGVITFLDSAQTSFNRLQFGGTTSSFPSLKRNATALETKLADDSAYAPHAMQYLDVTDGVTAPAAATGRARIYVDTADGDLKIIFADGTVKTIVTDT